VGASPESVLRDNRAQAARLAETSGKQRTLRMLTRAQRDLERRLREATGLDGPGGESFTATQLRVTLAQVRDTLRSLKGDLKAAVEAQADEAAEQQTASTVRYLNVAERAYRGVNQRLPIREAALLDSVSAGTEASVLRRLSGDPENPASRGILDRYGESVIGKFEEALQLRFVARQPWAEVRDALVGESPFLQGAPASWAERIVRTETMNANNRAGWEAMRGANAELGDMVKILMATFDDRTGADSIAVHGQIRHMEEAFESWFGLYQHPPNRPNDREIVVPQRLSWPLPPTLAQRPDAEVLSRWVVEGRKGSPPARPLMSTLGSDEVFGSAPPQR
jgi:hypothetical protein